MDQTNSCKPYDLAERTFLFAKNVRSFVNKIPKTMANIEDGRQLLKSSGSVGANYIEANESLGKKDFALHIKISKKEAKESSYWLRLLELTDNTGIEKERQDLVQEANELKLIFNSIANKSSKIS